MSVIKKEIATLTDCFIAQNLCHGMEIFAISSDTCNTGRYDVE